MAFNYASKHWLDQLQGFEKIGEGTYGVVFKCFDPELKQTVALKKMRLDGDEEGVPSTALREIAILKTLNHQNIVRLLRQHGDDRQLHLEFEYVEKDFKVYMEDPQTNLAACQELVKVYLYQMLQGVHYCHQRMILHRDLKPQNILLDRQTNVVKIADFGLARQVGVPIRAYTREVITLWYRAPEILLGGPVYNTKVDIWSLGCIFAEMAAGQPLFPGESEIDQLFKIFRVLGTPTPQVWPDLGSLPDFNIEFPKWHPTPLQNHVTKLCPAGIDLLQRMLCYDPNQRINAQDALEHPYFATAQQVVEDFYRGVTAGVIVAGCGMGDWNSEDDKENGLSFTNDVNMGNIQSAHLLGPGSAQTSY